MSGQAWRPPESYVFGEGRSQHVMVPARIAAFLVRKGDLVDYHLQHRGADPELDGLGVPAEAGRDWPKNARALTGTLRRRAPSLRRVGKANAVRWHLAPPAIPQEASDEASDAASDEPALSLCLSLKEEKNTADRTTPRESPGTSLATLASLATPSLGLGHLPGRCANCEHHVQTQGHAPGCPLARAS